MRELTKLEPNPSLCLSQLSIKAINEELILKIFYSIVTKFDSIATKTTQHIFQLTISIIPNLLI